MNKIEVHAIEGNMIIENGSGDKFARLRSENAESDLVFVVSPLCDETLELKRLLDAAQAHDERLWSMMEMHTESWVSLIEKRVSPSSRQTILNEIKNGFNAVEDLLRAIWLVGDISEGAVRFLDTLLARWVSLLLHELLQQEKIDAVIMSQEEFLAKSDSLLGSKSTFILCGELKQSDVKKNDRSSEYAGALIANRIHASSLTFWNPSSLVTTADVQDVPGASVIRSLTYAEATELSFFGSPVIHPQNMVPIMDKSVSLHLRSFAHIDDRGTVIDETEGRAGKRVVKGFSVIRDVALINVEGAGMIGVPGISMRLFAAMNDADISVVLISQASSEYSICFAVPSEQASLAKAIAHSTFAHEIEQHRITNIESEYGCAILAAVGENMTGVPGISGTFFGALGKAHVNVRAIAQGSSERNISAVILEKDSKRALRALHAGFFLSNQALSVGVFGPGNIGGTLLDQIGMEAARLKSDFGVDIRIRAIANTTVMLIDEAGIDLDNWEQRFKTESVPIDYDLLVKHVSASYFPHSVLIDCTTSNELPNHYISWIEKGIHIITPNKKAGTAPYPIYEKLMETARRYGKHFMYETTVGAGLPVIGTLKDLIQTGDRIRSVEGIVSGTLAYLFSRYDGSVPFSTLVREAKDMGFTEPDPRDDLSGMDVARKTVILAREMVYKVELSDLDVASLVPEELRDVPLDEFMERMELMDENLLSMYKEADKEGKRLRYVGRIGEDGICQVELAAYDASHPFARSRGTDNVVAFTTERYSTQPLVIQGPGAGPAVTAGGVFADLLRVSAYLGASL
ncbi:MAG: bifunctional aspartate kinase/homoserine dehydrogenase I [Sphaerochaetaceae bacterium]|nr:bifunctional aspartate kinase/homoserine dehydrogenase I [Sphaerochaetaceae bacterium]